MRRSLKECFVDTALAMSKKTAISFVRDGILETQLSYSELDLDSNCMANTLLDFGVKKGDRVIILLPKSLFFVVAYIALLKIGAIAVPLNPGFRKSELEYFIQDADPELIISGTEQEAIIRDTGSKAKNVVINTQEPYGDEDFFRTASDALPASTIELEDPGIIIYTSGTTGIPKGAVLSQSNLIHNIENIINAWEINESDVLCHVLPVFHLHGLCLALHTCLIAGAHVLFIDQFSPDTVVDFLAEKEVEPVCTLFMGVPSMYVKMLDYVGDRKLNFEHLRLLTSGSAPLLPKDFERINEAFGKEPVEREGMTETVINFSNPLRRRKKPGSVGLPLSNLEVRIVDPKTMGDIQPGEVGEILLKGPSVTSGYWRKPQETAKTFVNGWFRTGDLGKVDNEGYHYLTDRIKHVIISGGENISPKEVENVINRLEGVLESAVIGIPDERWGEKVVAAIVTKSDSNITQAHVQSHCKEHILNWKCPKQVVFVKKLPKNTMGKILREDVRELFIH